MIHLGDITKINGADIPIVDCITAGSPCQDLSVAGKRAGLEGERSGLFMEQIRVIKEMREHDRRTNKRTDEFIRPRYMVWENVPGALSSGKDDNGNTLKGEDFRCVLEETAKIVQPDAVIPRPDKGKWSKPGCIMGDGWSIAWRVHDAQFWGVPQRRKRIALVADFAGLTAPEVLFERKGLSGDFEQGCEEGETSAGETEDRFGESSYTLKIRGGAERESNGRRAGKGALVQTEKSATLGVSQDQTLIQIIENHPNDSRAKLKEDGVVQCLSGRMGTGGNNTPMVLEAYGFKPRQGSAAHGIGYEEEKCPTLNSLCDSGVLEVHCVGNGQLDQAKLSDKVGALNCMHDQQAVMISEDVCATLDASYYKGCGNRGGVERQVVATYAEQDYSKYKESPVSKSLKATSGTCGGGSETLVSQSIVRRLTPLECERLQGFPDGWTDIGEWTDSKGKLRQTSDSARYKALGNSIALPFWFYLLRRISAQYERPATLGSLFDGIGGFPLCWERCNGEGTAIWASEIEEFPIAVTKERFK